MNVASIVFVALAAAAMVVSLSTVVAFSPASSPTSTEEQEDSSAQAKQFKRDALGVSTDLAFAPCICSSPTPTEEQEQEDSSAQVVTQFKRGAFGIPRVCSSPILTEEHKDCPVVIEKATKKNNQAMKGVAETLGIDQAVIEEFLGVDFFDTMMDRQPVQDYDLDDEFDMDVTKAEIKVDGATVQDLADLKLVLID